MTRNAGRVEVVLAPTAYEARLADLLARVSSGEVSPGDAARELRDLPFSDLGFAKVDHHRELRQGACEIVYAEGKTPGESSTPGEGRPGGSARSSTDSSRSTRARSSCRGPGPSTSTRCARPRPA